MSKNSLYFACFALGVAIGVYGAGGYFKTKYETLANTEIESARKAFHELRKNPVEKPSLSEVVSSLMPDELPERDISKLDKIVKEERYDAAPGPYVISPDDFGGTFEYECVSLVYYADGVLVDDNQNVVTDVEDCIGEESLTHFGEYEDDAVHVRNDEKHCDYEILLDERKWSDVKQKWAR